MVLQYFYSSEYSLMLFGETWKCKVWMHSSGKFANSSEFNVTSTDGMIRLRFKLMSFNNDGIIFSRSSPSCLVYLYEYFLHQVC